MHEQPSLGLLAGDSLRHLELGIASSHSRHQMQQSDVMLCVKIRNLHAIATASTAISTLPAVITPAPVMAACACLQLVTRVAHTDLISNAAGWWHLLQSHWTRWSPHCCGAPGLLQCWKPAQLGRDVQLLHAQAVHGSLGPHLLTLSS